MECSTTLWRGGALAHPTNAMLLMQLRSHSLVEEMAEACKSMQALRPLCLCPGIHWDASF